MTQAHKTPGALIEIHDDLREGGIAHDIYGWLKWDDRVFEVIKEEPYGHLHFKDAITGELILPGGWHDDNFKTLSPAKKRAVIKQIKGKNNHVI